MDDRSVIQWDKDDLDALGLIKVDILALGMLSAIRRALEFVGAKRGRPLRCRMQDVPHDDEPTYDMICAADSVGIFQVESRAQMSMLPRLQPRCYYDLVIEVAIVRPGPIQGGMVHPYLQQPQRRRAVDYPEELRPALQRTLGVPIFQEQVMQIAILAADFTARRGRPAAPRDGGLEAQGRPRALPRAAGRPHGRRRATSPTYAERIFKQIEGFGEYGFPESHAASFALLVYVSAWLKCHHPDAFLAALLNSQPMGFYAPAQLVRDAREHGVEVRPVDVGCSEWRAVLEGRRAGAVRPCAGAPGLQPHRAAWRKRRPALVAARAEAPFASAEDLARRAALDAQAAAVAGAGRCAARRSPATATRRPGRWPASTPAPRAMLRETRAHEAAGRAGRAHARSRTCWPTTAPPA